VFYQKLGEGTHPDATSPDKVKSLTRHACGAIFYIYRKVRRVRSSFDADFAVFNF